MDQQSSGYSTELSGYFKSVRRLALASLIIGSAMWYTGKTTNVNIVEVPAQLNPATNVAPEILESS